MAERDFNIPGKRWPLLEQLPRGPVRDNLTELKHELEKIDHAAGVLTTLARLEALAEQGTVTVATQTLISSGCYIKAAVESVFGYLDRAFAKEARQGGGE